MLRRRHLFEIADQPWCPEWMRVAMTGYLQAIIARTRPYAPVAGPLAGLLTQAGAHDVLDLCSGAGGPWPSLRDELQSAGATVDVVCSDVAPNADAAVTLESHPGFRYERTPVSALAVPSSLGGARTMFSALHHFSPNEVRAILADAQQAGVPFAAFEATTRRWKGVLATMVIPVAVLLLMPTVRPRRWLPLLLTYLPPLLPFVSWWDGLVSTLRTYTVEELREIIATLPGGAYAWEVTELGGAPLPVLAVLGRPAARAA